MAALLFRRAGRRAQLGNKNDVARVPGLEFDAMRSGMQFLPSKCIVLLFVDFASAFYLPGVAPRKYTHGEQLMVKVNTLTSDLTPLQVRFALPSQFNLQNSIFGVCKFPIKYLCSSIITISHSVSQREESTRWRKIWERCWLANGLKRQHISATPM